MGRLIELAADNIREALAGAASDGNSGQELRLLFSGLPRATLYDLWESLTNASGGIVRGDGGLIPVFFVDPERAALLDSEHASRNGGSMCCGWPEVIAARGNPDLHVFIVLRFHADPVPGSVSTAFTNAGQETGIADPTGIEPMTWLRENPLLEGCVRDLRASLRLEDSGSAEELVHLLRSALSDVEELEGLGREPIHQRQWALVGDILDLAARGGSVLDVVAALGFPRMTSEILSASEQTSALRKLGDYFQTEGVRPGIGALLSTEDVEDECRDALEGLRSHLPPECDGSRFRASPTTYFRVPTRPCAWWELLTVERILALLEDHDDDDEQPGLMAEPSSDCVLLPPSKGANYWVTAGSQPPRFVAFRLDEETGNRQPLDADLRANTIASRKARTGAVPLVTGPDSGEWIDAAPPEHSRPLTYEFEHPDFEAAGCKVVVLQTYKPGFQVRASGAKKLKAIRKGRKADKAAWVSSVEFPAPGRHQLDLYFDSDRIGVEKVYLAGAGKLWPGLARVEEDDAWEEVRVQEAGESRVLLQIPVEGDSVCTIALTRLDSDALELISIELLVGTETTLSTSSVFDSLATQNQHLGRRPHAVAVEAAELHAWMIKRLATTPDEGHDKARPIGVVFSEDHDSLEHSAGPELLSATRFVSDPRPMVRLTDIPAAVLKSERAVHETIRDLLAESQAAHLEELDLWLLTREPRHREMISAYVRQYLEWFRSDPRTAGWYESYSLFMPETHGSVLEPEPTAVLLSPLHPLRLAWMVEAQDLLKRALDSNTPCPFSAVLNPSTVPDAMTMSCSTGTGEWVDVPLLAVGTSSDYWSLLWNAKRLPRLQDAEILDVLRSIGLHVDGLAAGMAEGQLRRALSDLDSLACAQSILRVAIFSSEAGSRACTDGLVDWCVESLGDEDPWSGVSGRRLHVHDYRQTDQPEPEVVANLTRTTGGVVEWYRLQDKERRKAGAQSTIDLAVLSHLGMLNPRLVQDTARSAVSEGALVRHRVRTNHAVGSELVVTESRVAASSSNSRSSSLHKDMRALSRVLESSIGSCAFQYAPNWSALYDAAQSASYCAIASSDTDPSGFSRPEFGTYLWDYDVPSLARHGVQDSGYYLIARESADAVAAMKFAFSHLGSALALSDDHARQLLAEVSNRGVPSLKQLSAGGSAASGEIGVLTALQLLQPGFGARPSSAAQSPFPPVDGAERVNILIPIDPFRDQLDALRKGLSPGAQQLRPDLLAVSILAPSDTVQPVRIHVTPIEVKCRWEKMVQNQQERALSQARALVELLGSLVERIDAGMATEEGDGTVDLWSLAGRSVFAAWLDFGFRIYARASDWLEPSEWANLHQRVANDVLQGLAAVSVASEGRLILVHHSKGSGPRDADGDGFTETLEITLADAAIALSDPEGRAEMSAGVVRQLGHWGLYGSDKAAEPDARAGDEATEEPPQGPVVGGSVGPEKSVEPPPTRVRPKDIESPARTGVAVRQSVAAEAELGLKFRVGTTSRVLRERPVYFHPSNTKLSHLNVGIVGDMGTGKTQLTKYLVTRMVNEPQANRGQAPKFLIFDYKKDYSQPDFVNAVNADVVAPEDIPLNIMAIPPRPDGKPHRRRDWVRRANFLSDTLSKIYGGIGPVQRSRLKGAVVSAYEDAGARAPVLGDVLAAYEEAGKPDSVSGILSDLVDLEVFTEDPDCVVEFGDFLSGVSVIQLNMLGADQRLKNTLVVFMLSLFYDHMIRLPKRPFSGTDPQLRYIDSMLLVDEADNIMKHDFDVLRQVLQEGREFGVGVLLASQYLSHYRRADYDYREPLLTWFVHRVPNIVPRDLEGLGLTSIDADTVNRVKELNNHEFFCTTLGEAGTFAMGNAFWRMYEEAWKRQRPGEWEEIARLDGAARAEALANAKVQSPPDVSLHLRVQRLEEALRDSASDGLDPLTEGLLARLWHQGRVTLADALDAAPDRKEEAAIAGLALLARRAAGPQLFLVDRRTDPMRVIASDEVTATLRALSDTPAAREVEVVWAFTPDDALRGQGVP